MAELIWDGKYDEQGRRIAPVKIALPFQTIETVNESAQDRRRTLELFAEGREGPWRNRLIWGDKKYVLAALLPEFAGKVNLIYIDPPFDTGADFSFNATIPDHPETPEDETTGFLKEPSMIEQKAYRDTWGRGLNSYLEWFYEAVRFLSELLLDSGSLYVHLDWHIGHYAKVILDEVMGPDNFINEIAWRKLHSPKSQSKQFGNQWDSILLYAKMAEQMSFVPVRRKHTEKYLKGFDKDDNDGKGPYQTMPLKAYGVQRSAKRRVFEWRGVTAPWLYSEENLNEMWKAGKIYVTEPGDYRYKHYLADTEGALVSDLWSDDEVLPLQGIAEENLDYPTQKPEALLRRIVSASSSEGDLVLDCFVGSGTSAAVAEKLNRRWIACDLSRFAIHTTRKRLLGIPGVKPFVVQNLGKYERQAWQGAEFPGNGRTQAEQQRDKEAAYRKFILELYHATPVSGHTWLHGKKAGRMVHVGAVDAPVTQSDVKAVAREVWKAIGTGKDAPEKAGVDILGWEFALEVNELAKQVAAEARVDVAFKKIPREVLDPRAVEQGDVHFFELGAVGVDVKTRGWEVHLKLKDFVIPLEDIPDEARKAIKHWSQLVDYWAVDWDYKGDTFHNQWQTYRTRKDPKLELEATYRYEKPGKYTVVVKVIDLLGNDTTTAVEAEVK